MRKMCSSVEYHYWIDARYLYDCRNRRQSAHRYSEYEYAERKDWGHDDRHGSSGGRLHDDPSQYCGNKRSDHCAQQSLAKNDLVNVEGGRSHGAHSGKLVQVILGTRIKRLRDDHGPHDDPENGPGNERGSTPRVIKPLNKAALVKLFGCENFSIAEIAAQTCANAFEISARRDLNKIVCAAVRVDPQKV